MTATPLDQARELLAAGDHPGAERLLRDHLDDEACAVRLREWLVAERREAEAVEIARHLAGGASPEADVSRSFLAFVEGDLQRALGSAQAALAVLPDLATALNHAGRALHNAGRGDAARRAFQQATTADPDYAEAWLSLGHVQRVTGEMDAAVRSYERAVALAPWLDAARHDLGVTLYNADLPVEALAVFDALLERSPAHLGALVDSGLTLVLLGRLGEAQERLERALDLAPDHPLAHLYLGQLHNERTNTEAALTHLRRATELEPGEVEAWIELTGVLEQANRIDEAIEALRRGFQADPQHPGLHLEGAKLERRRNDPAAAVRRLRGLDPRSMPPRLQQQYWFELGLNLDRDGQGDAAVDALGRGNALARRGTRSRAVDPDALDRRCRALDEWLDAGCPGAEAPEEERDHGAGLCFLVGFPRSGTTLVDTSLATSPQVDALEEPPTLDLVVRELENADPPYPMALAALDAAGVNRARATYDAAVARLLGHAPAGLLIDKMPLRFLHSGLIRRLFPAAKLVFVARHPCDVVLSNFMQQYGVNETNIHFDTLEHSARTYARIMGLWERLESTLDLDVLNVRYEDLVADLAGSLDPVCDFLGVDSATLSFDRKARLATRDRVRTSSYQQVGEDIYDRAAGRWTRYRAHLAPLLPLLAPTLERYGYGD